MVWGAFCGVIVPATMRGGTRTPSLAIVDISDASCTAEMPDLLTHGNRRRTKSWTSDRRAWPSASFAGKFDAGALAESEGANVFVEAIVAETHGHFDAPTSLDSAMMSATESMPCGLLSWMRVPLMTIEPIWQSNISSGRVTFSSRPAEMVTILKVEPGSYTSLTAWFLSVSGRISLRLFGLKVGRLVRARISPV